ncbi:MAG: nucleotidyltransferase [Oscillochloris sp.]|nr:nucleotidyltransferase [Oscillochloris sp.]
MHNIDTRLHTVVTEQPYPLLFATLSGAHLYGFPSPDSDYDLRGVHVLPLREVLGLNNRRETIEVSAKHDGLELDLVTHDVEMFCRQLLRRNGHILEQLCSPLIVHTTPTHAALRELVPQIITRHHANHYLGFAAAQWQTFTQSDPKQVKPLLYVFRVLLSGIHLMRTGEVESNIAQLNAIFQLPYIPDLMARKLAGSEQSTLDAADTALFSSEYTRLRAELEAAYATSSLPDMPSARAEINTLLVHVRLEIG